MESMKVQIDAAEARLAKVTAELLTMTEEAQFLKVLPATLSFQIDKRKLRSLHLK